jgi:two-component system alkaline phosphatase synthesis response regulator PhoP
MSAGKKILVVDDERHIVEFLVMNLRQNKYDSMIAYDGFEAIEKASASSPDLIILDSMLPGMSGIETCRRLKQEEKTRRIPIIFLSAKSEESDKVLGLSLGADDYITKPFGLKELFARIEAVLRRAAYPSQEGALGGMENVTDPGTEGARYGTQHPAIKLQDLSIDVDGFTVDREGLRIPLSPTEFALLVFLARKAGKVVARAELIEELAVSVDACTSRALDVHVRNLRKKLKPGSAPAPGSSFRYIETVRGVGLKALP